jgi:hypothetical protein
MFHVEFDNAALDLLDVDHVGHFQLELLRLATVVQTSA